jgi:hypothetical protein
MFVLCRQPYKGIKEHKVYIDDVQKILDITSEEYFLNS